MQSIPFKLKQAIEPGQVWYDDDPRSKDRYLLIEKLTDTHAECFDLKRGAMTKIRKDRLKPGPTGYSLILEMRVATFLMHYIRHAVTKELQP